MRVSFDLDEVLFVSPETHKTEPPLAFPLRILYKERLRFGAPALLRRLQELGYIRSGATLTNRYTQETAQRVILFQRQTGMTEDGVAWQELQEYLFSDKAPACSQTLPRIRTKVADKRNRMICGCCMGEGCECCNFTGYVYN